jgi:hypothetical protein
MVQLIDKAAVVAEIKRISCENPMDNSWYVDTEELLNFINTLEVKDPYEQCIQYPSVKDGIKAHAETYSFNTESLLFNQLTKEQQVLWRKEIEQACISGGDAGVGLARDIRYKENLEVKEVNLKKEIDSWYYHLNIPENCNIPQTTIIIDIIEKTAKHFFELGIYSQLS